MSKERKDHKEGKKKIRVREGRNGAMKERTIKRENVKEERKESKPEGEMKLKKDVEVAVKGIRGKC